ncbi:MAG: glycosyltransferase family 39 protein [Nitrospiraceae bacterium]
MDAESKLLQEMSVTMVLKKPSVGIPMSLANETMRLAGSMASEVDVGPDNDDATHAVPQTLAVGNSTGSVSALNHALVTQAIRYRMPEAGEVLLVWWINGWETPPPSMRPAGTFESNGAIHTPMTRDGEDFVTTVEAPAGTVMTHAFLITKTREGATMSVWDANGYPYRYYVTVARSNRPATILATVNLAKAQTSPDNSGASLRKQEIQYEMREEGEVFLVWGLNGWRALPESLHPSGTVIKNGMMHTPMTQRGAAFVATVQVPAGSTMDYGFLVTKTRSGSVINAWDGAETFRRTLGMVNEPIVVASNVGLGQGGQLRNGLPNDIYLLITVLLVTNVVILLFLRRLPRERRRRIVLIALAGLTLQGLILRLLVASHGQYLLTASSPLLGDERGYDYLAVALLNGPFIEWPGRVPVYSLFLAGGYWLFGHSFAPILYVQAIVGSTAVPLTFLLARRYARSMGSLGAAVLIAVHPALLAQVMRLDTGAIYTPLLLLAVLAWLRSLDHPLLKRFAFAGALLALANLCRPTAVFLPLLVLFFMPNAIDRRRKLIAWGVYTGMMLAVMAPWAYHNYHTDQAILPLSATTTTIWQGSPEYYHLVFDQKRNAFEIWNMELNPSRNGGKNPFSIEGDRYFTEQALESIRQEPGLYLWYVFQKLWFFWIGNPSIDWPSYEVFGFDTMRPYFSTPHIIGVFISRMLPIVALVGLIVLRGHLKPFLPLVAVCAYFTLVHAITYAEVGHSEPLHPFLAAILAGAASHLVRLFQESRQRATWMAQQQA